MGDVSHRLGWEGRTVDGRFALLEQLGGSAKSDVFLTVRHGVQRAAIKLINAADVDADAYLALWDEAQSLAHPHLVTIFETGRAALDDTGLVYVVMELAETNLSKVLAEAPLTPPVVRDIFNPILDALSYLHAAGVVHGHVKPSNFLQTSEGWKLAADALLDANGRREPTPMASAYDAPEIANGSIVGASDTWSVGMTLTEALTQLLPIRDAVTGKMNVPASLPASLATVVRECLRTDPHDRCPTREISVELASIPAPAAPGVPATPPPADEQIPFPTVRFEAVADPIPAVPEPVSRVPVTQEPEPVIREIDPAVFAAETQHTPRRSAPEPRYVPIAEADSVPEPRYAQVPESRFARERHPAPERFEPPAASTLFAEEDEESSSSRLRLVVVLIGVLVLAGCIGALVLRNNGFNFSLPNAARTAPAAGQPAPQAPATASPASSDDASQSASQSATTPESPKATPTNPTAAPPESSAPSSEIADALPSKSGALPAPTPAAPAKSAQPAAETKAAEETPQVASPRPANAPGAIAERVMPNVSPSAWVSMHGPVEVILRLTVNREGAVEDASYVSPGPGNYFARVAQRAVQGWKFDAPQRSGRAEPSFWIVHFRFAHRNIEVTAAEEGR
ncbi:MAG: protein kinase [Terracidiphilus sp.]